jgi:Tol biopolymer transport system component
MPTRTASFLRVRLGRGAPIVLSLLLIVLAALLPTPGGAQESQRCFPETGHCISGPIRAYWERNGGLPVFGYPISPLKVELVEGTWTGPVQWFERDRLEDHSAEGQGVLAGRLGALRFQQLYGSDWQQLPGDSGAQMRCRFFTETQFNLCEPFLSYWRNNGGLERFGYPITRERGETIEGREYRVQYFERRRMEHHPENAGTPFEVLLGLLGREVFTAPQPHTAAGRILFASTVSGNQEIWAMSPDRSSPVNLSNNPGAGDFQPAVAANGAKIAYVVGTERTSDQDIWVMNADGGQKRRLTSGPAAEWGPTLSPDGSRVAFVSSREGSADIFVMNSDGTGATINLTSYGPNSAQYAPAWSPDGTRIAFVSDEGGKPNIWVMRPDGSERYNLTDEPNKRYNNPAWSPDSSRIAYEYDFSTSDQDIEFVNADGTGRQTVVNMNTAEANPAWAVDGSGIVYEQGGDIYLVSFNGTSPLNLTNSVAATDRDAVWGP